MSNLFDDGIKYLNQKGQDIFAINIGAMDGIMFDELHSYKMRYDIKTLYVEPIPYLFEKLKNNITDHSNNIFENSAISDYDGKIDMLTINKEAIDSGRVHNCFYGMSAVYPPKNGLGSEGDKETVNQFGEMVSVDCITFKTLMDKHKISTFDIIKIDTEGHDYKIFEQIDLEIYKPTVIRVEWINLSDDEKNRFKEKLTDSEYVYDFSGQDIIALRGDVYKEIYGKEKKIKSGVTLVTGLWDLGRSDLNEGWSRNFESHYLKKFKEFLEIPANLIIFGDAELESFVQKNKSHDNIQFILRDLNWFRIQFYDRIQKIRNSEVWYNQKTWLSQSTQAKLEMYNPVVMQKMFLLNDAKIISKFHDDYIFWLDAGITNTVHRGYFTYDKVLDKIKKYVNKFSFICFPYKADGEIHGFDHESMNRIVNKKVEKVARGGFFGGPSDTISQATNLYYSIMDDTLSRDLMGTEESLFSILVYKYPQEFDYFEIESNGLLGKFFENLKNDQLVLKNESNQTDKNKKMDLTKTSLYVITFNSPDQFESLIESFYNYDLNFIEKPKKYLINNSTDRSTDVFYDQLCEEFEFEQLRFPENLGICGGRQYIAEHFEKSESDFMFFFEDDMFFYEGKDTTCKNGFNRYVNNLYINSLEITKNEGFDFLKLNFTEFYGDNSTQWSWYNVPQDVRNERWPDYNRLPERGFDPNAPRTKFEEIKSYKGIPFASGEIYYCNWPQIVTKDGNRKMFLNTTWAHPHEQTWMSYIFQQTLRDNIQPGILLISPIDHNRFDHYDAKLRKES